MTIKRISGTLSSNGKKISSSQGYHVIEFFDPSTPDEKKVPVSYIHFETFDKGCFIILNDDEGVLHEVDPQSSISFELLRIYKITIVEPNVQYRWTAIL